MTKKILASMGDHVNVERGACFSQDTRIGNNSGLGINCRIQEGGVTIGNNVLMGPEVWIYTTNHKFTDTDIPICF